jgi:hypothetical protein
VPVGATFVVRADLTHVMFYEPFRRSIFPLVDSFGPQKPSRRERLSALGLSVNADVREVLFALGPAEGDWIAAIGGHLPRSGAAKALADVLGREGQRVERAPQGYAVPAASLVFDETADGVLLLGSSFARLDSARPASDDSAVLGLGAGGLSIAGGRLPAPLRALHANFRTGSVVGVNGEVSFQGEPALAERQLRGLFGSVSALDKALVEPLNQAEFSMDSSRVAFRVSLPRQAVERLAALAAGRLPGQAPWSTTTGGFVGP